MACTNLNLSLVFALCSVFLLVPLPPCNAVQHLLTDCGLEAIYNLGDSISDSGNLIRLYPQVPYARLPYGQNFNNTATGRCSNGLLMIDYIAKSAGIPFVNAYLNRNPSTSDDNGINFAVAGATALGPEILVAKQIFSPVNNSLSSQLNWMSSYFDETSSNNKEKFIEKMKKSLFLVGEIGGNDYNYAFFQGKTAEKLKTDLVPEVVKAIKDAATRVISYGATRVIVPGNFPIGCFPIYLTGFQTNDSTAYDECHCLKDLNNFAIYHNDQLKQAIQELQKENPNVTILYGDYYNAFQYISQHIDLLGFDRTSVHKACCGVGGEYNFNITKMCASGPDVPVCENPDKFISWDGVHLTQMAYQDMASWLVDDIFPNLKC